MPDITPSTESQPKQDLSLILPQRFDGRMSELAATLHSNPATGFGMPKRDSAVYQAIGIPSVLNELEIRMLYRHDWLARRRINLPARDMIRAGINFHISDGNEDDTSAITNKYRELEGADKFRQAEQLALMFGKAYIVIRTVGESLEKPIDENRPKEVESLWVYDRYQLKPAMGQWNIIDPEEYQLVTYPGGSHLLGRDGEPMRLGQKIHKSRVLVFWGEELPPADRRDNEGCDDSVLQTMYSVLLRYRNASGAINKAIESFSILRVAIEGLAGLISKEGGVEKAKALMQEISMQMSLFGTLLTDKTTAEAGFESRGLGGVEPVFSKIIKEELTAASGLPYYKLWGQVAKTSLAESGSAESKAYADLVLGWQEEDFRKPHEYLFRYLMAGELGFVPDDWSFEYESLYSQSPEEKAKIFNMYVGAYAKLASIPGVEIGTEILKTIASGEIETLGNAIDSDAIEVEEDDLEVEEDDMPTEEGEEEDPEGGREDEENWWRADAATKPYLVWFGSRRTAIAVRATSRSQAISKARARKKRGGDNVKKVRLATAQEQKQAARGSWIRSGPNYEKPGTLTIRGNGPKPKNYKKDDEELRTDAIRLSDLPTVGSRVRYKGRLYVPNRPYKSGGKFVVLAVKAGYARLVTFSPTDVDVSQDWGEFTPQRWANLYHSFGSPMVEELPEEESKTDADGDRILDDAEFDTEGAINLLQVLEDVVGEAENNRD